MSSFGRNKVEFINTKNLQIARENIGLEDFVVSKKLFKSKNNIVSEWEDGKSLPSWSQVAKLSKEYGISELLLFSKNTIKKNKQIPDYRVGQGIGGDDKINKLINIVVKRQRWLEKEFKKEGVDKNSLQGSGKKIKTPFELADTIKNKLDIKLSEIKKLSGSKARRNTLNYLINKAENHGIFIGKTISYHRIEVRDMRGLFVSNDYCPFIILNRRDAVSAQIFSLIHELAHLFRKTDAISNSLDFRKTSTSIDSEEVFCNKVAAELLLPKDEFQGTYYSRSDIDNFSDIYKVSKLSIFYRLKELNKISKNEVKELEKEIIEETRRNIEQKNKKKSTGGDYNNNMKDSNGNLLNNYISNHYSDNKIGYVEASNILNCSVEKI